MPVDGDALESGCDLDISSEPATLDEDVDWFVLFGDVDPDSPAELAARVAAYEELFNG